MSGSENLVRMANDIGNFFRAQPNREDAIAGRAAAARERTQART